MTDIPERQSPPEQAAQSDAVREASVETVARTIHTYCSRNMIMTYLDAEEDCEGLARAIVAALATPPAPVEGVEAELAALPELASGMVGNFTPDLRNHILTALRAIASPAPDSVSAPDYPSIQDVEDGR